MNHFLMFFVNLICFVGYFVLWYFVLFLFMSFIERKKPFIDTKIVYKYNFYKFIKSLLFQSVYDFVYHDPDSFPYTGIVMYEGNQGSGKTISMVYDILNYCNQYPKLVLSDNLGIAAEGVRQIPLVHWKQLLDIKNGKLGVISAIDEVQMWLSSKDSKNLDPACLGVICQNRKNRRLFLCTTQKFYLASKDLRMQTSYVKSCFTIFGCIGGYITKVPELDSSGQLVRSKFKGIKIYVHSNQLRQAYDTYKVISRLSDVGFNDKKYLITEG